MGCFLLGFPRETIARFLAEIDEITIIFLSPSFLAKVSIKVAIMGQVKMRYNARDCNPKDSLNEHITFKRIGDFS